MNKNLIISLSFIIFSIILGLITNDLVIGGTLLATGLLNSYYAGLGKRVNYIVGLINCLVFSYVCYANGLYGMFFFYFFVFAPLQVNGFIAWQDNLDKNNTIKAREFRFENACKVLAFCIIGSIVLGYILTLIPNQRLAFMDATSNIVNLCAIVLLEKRFKESWWLWLINNVIDLFIWIYIVFQGGGNYALMSLFAAIAYLILNINGIMLWQTAAKKNKKERV